MFTRRQRHSRALRIFFATDVHGADRCFRKFLAAAKVYEVDVLILGGDLAGKGLVPVELVNGNLHAHIEGKPVSVPAAKEEWLKEEINRLGFYAVRMTDEDIARAGAAPADLETLFRNEIVSQVQRWCELATNRLASNVRCIITPGNDDPFAIDPVLRGADRIECPEGELCQIGPVLLASLGDVTPTPWRTHREYSEDDLAARIASIMERVPQGEPAVVNFHCPPYGSGLDVALELDETLKPVLRGGQPSMVPVGSTAVRDAIKRYMPTVGLHGHIHESRGYQKIGRTMCLNPGSDYTGDILRGAVVDLAADGTCVDFLLTTG